jgi:O-antigen/teichoic acid export membrane protein
LVVKIHNYLNSLLKKLAHRIGFNVQYFLSNGFWVVINQGFTLLFSFLMSVVLARYLSVKSFGEYQFVLSVFSILSALSLPGLGVAIARAVARNKDQSYLDGITESIKWSMLGVLVIIGFAIYHFLYDDPKLGIGLIISSLFFPVYFTYSRWQYLLQGKEKFKLQAKWKIGQSFGTFVLIYITVIAFPESLMLVLLVYFLSNTGFNLFWHFWSLQFIKNPERDTECLSNGIYLTKLGIFGIVVSQFDKIILGFLDIELLAIYVIALKLLEALMSFFKSIASITFPKFARKDVRLGLKPLTVLAICGLVLSIFLFYISTPIVTFFYSTKYYDSIEVFKQICFVLPFVVINQILLARANAQMDKQLLINTGIWAPLISIIGSTLVFIVFANTSYFVISKVYLLQICFLVFLIKNRGQNKIA